MSSNVVCLSSSSSSPSPPPPSPRCPARTSRIAGYSRHRAYAFVYHACSRTARAASHVDVSTSHCLSRARAANAEKNKYSVSRDSFARSTRFGFYASPSHFCAPPRPPSARNPFIYLDVPFVTRYSRSISQVCPGGTERDRDRNRWKERKIKLKLDR